MRKLYSIVCMFIFVLSCCFIFKPTAVSAALAFENTNYSYKFTADNGKNADFFTNTSSESIESVSSSNEKVAVVSEYNWCYFTVAPKGPGYCDIVVTGDGGSKRTFKITVTNDCMSGRLVEDLAIDKNFYGTSTLEIWNLKGLSGTVRIGSDTYKYTNKKDNAEGITSCGKIKLKRLYKLNTKIYITATDGTYSKTVVEKITSDTFCKKVAAKGKTLKVTCWNLHKGDYIQFKYKGKIYKKKVKTNRDRKTSVVTIKTKKKISPKAKFTLKIYTKDKARLDKTKIKLKKGKYTPF